LLNIYVKFDFRNRKAVDKNIARMVLCGQILKNWSWEDEIIFLLICSTTKFCGGKPLVLLCFGKEVVDFF
jgi:hypothetical protein